MDNHKQSFQIRAGGFRQVKNLQLAIEMITSNYAPPEEDSGTDSDESLSLDELESISEKGYYTPNRSRFLKFREIAEATCQRKPADRTFEEPNDPLDNNLTDSDEEEINQFPAGCLSSKPLVDSKIERIMGLSLEQIRSILMRQQQREFRNF